MLDRIKIIVYFLVITFSVFLSSLGRMYLTTSVISFAAPSQIKLSYSQVKYNYIIYNINLRRIFVWTPLLLLLW